MPELIDQLGRAPFAAVILLACIVMLFALIKGADGSLAPIAKRFLTAREQAMLVALEHVLPKRRHSKRSDRRRQSRRSSVRMRCDLRD